MSGPSARVCGLTWAGDLPIGLSRLCWLVSRLLSPLIGAWRLPSPHRVDVLCRGWRSCFRAHVTGGASSRGLTKLAMPRADVRPARHAPT